MPPQSKTDIRLFFAAPPRLWPLYQAPLQAALDRALADGPRRAVLAPEAPDPGAVDYLIVANGGVVQDYAPFRRAKAVLNLWAGVENLVGNRSLTQPLTRMVDPGLTQGMIEYVTAHVLRHHLGLDEAIRRAGGAPLWRPQAPPLARARPVTVLGLGALGLAVAQALRGLGFPVTGWARRPRAAQEAGAEIPCLSGPEGLAQALAQAQILVLMLPSTPETQNLLNAQTLALLPRGAVVINPARGQLIAEAALLAALDSGQVSQATLDVFRTEPLPEDHPFWRHPAITITPHIAAETRPETASDLIAENVRRGEAGLPFRHLVDRGAGY